MATAYSGSLLVVDDDKHIRSAMADYLRSLGHRTETAGDCSEAIARMEEFRFEVVVCDVGDELSWLGGSEGTATLTVTYSGLMAQSQIAVTDPFPPLSLAQWKAGVANLLKMFQRNCH